MLRTQIRPWGALGRRPDTPEPTVLVVERLDAIDLLPLVRRLPLLAHKARRGEVIQAHILEFLLGWIERLMVQVSLPAPAPDPLWEGAARDLGTALDAIRDLVDPPKMREPTCSNYSVVLDVGRLIEARAAEVASLQTLIAERDDRIWALTREVETLRAARNED